jgi:sigma-E factor negative regulatory protein RseA
MSEQLREALSALIDGEADEFETRRVLSELDADAELRKRWNTYHLIANRHQPGWSPQNGDRLLRNIWAAIDNDEGAVADTNGSAVLSATPVLAAGRRRWLGPLAGGGVAAAVALSVVLGFGDLGGQSGADLQAQQSPQASGVQLVAGGPIPAERADVLDTSQLDLQRTQAYMLHHVHHTSLNHQASVMPFVKVAAFESR